MAAVIRLKRRVDEDPLNAFVLNCKRQRTNQEGFQQESRENGNCSADETSTVLKFAGTFEKADNIPTHLQQRLSKAEAKEVISRVHRPMIASRNRAASRQTAQNSRFRIVNCTRSLSQTEGTEATTIVDVERDIIAAAASASTSTASNQDGTVAVASQSQGAPNQNEPGYVYDLYIADESQQQTHIPYIPDNLDDISVAIYDDPLYSSHRGLGDRSDDSAGEESEDSNDENNWRNDYPEEEDDAKSVDDDDIRRAVEDFDLEGDHELSSDADDESDGQDRFQFYAASSSDEDDDRVDPGDVARFGTAYAKYKARIFMQFGGDKRPGLFGRCKHMRQEDEDSDDIDPDGEFDVDSNSDDDSSSEDFNLYD